MATVDNVFYRDYEVKYKHRFQLQIDGIPAYIVKTAQRPNVSSTRKEVDYINTKRYYAGKYSWETMEITLQDPIVPSGAQKINEWFRQHHEFTTGISGYASSYKKNIVLNLLGADETIVEEWKLYGTFIQNINWNDLDYATDDLVDISATLSYDYAVLNY